MTVERLRACLADRHHIERDAHGGASLLGPGGMATVYLAEDLKHQRKVAGSAPLRPTLCRSRAAYRAAGTRRNREVEAARKRERSAKRFGTA
jgi:serine/threonine-protein kinase